MTKVNVSETKIRRLADAIYDSDFYVCGCGCFDLGYEDCVEFLAALFSGQPNKSLAELYTRLHAKVFGD